MAIDAADWVKLIRRQTMVDPTFAPADARSETSFVFDPFYAPAPAKDLEKIAASQPAPADDVRLSRGAATIDAPRPSSLSRLDGNTSAPAKPSLIPEPSNIAPIIVPEDGPAPGARDSSAPFVEGADKQREASEIQIKRPLESASLDAPEKGSLGLDPDDPARVFFAGNPKQFYEALAYPNGRMSGVALPNSAQEDQEEKREEEERDHESIEFALSIASQIRALEEKMEKLNKREHRARQCKKDIEELKHLRHDRGNKIHTLEDIENRMNRTQDKLMAYIAKQNPAFAAQLKIVMDLGKTLITAEIALPGEKARRHVVSQDETGRAFIEDKAGKRVYVDELDPETRKRVEMQIEAQRGNGEKFGNEDPALAARYREEQAKLRAMPGADKLLEPVLDMYRQKEELMVKFRAQKNALDELDARVKTLAERLRNNDLDPNDLEGSRQKIEKELADIAIERKKLEEEWRGLQKDARKVRRDAVETIAPEMRDEWRRRRGGQSMDPTQAFAIIAAFLNGDASKLNQLFSASSRNRDVSGLTQTGGDRLEAASRRFEGAFARAAADAQTSPLSPAPQAGQTIRLAQNS